MTRHVTYKDLADELIYGNWGSQYEDQKNMAKTIGHMGWQSALLIDIAKSLREIDMSLRPLRCRNFSDIPNRLNKIIKNTTKKRRKSVR